MVCLILNAKFKQLECAVPHKVGRIVGEFYTKLASRSTGKLLLNFPQLTFSLVTTQLILNKVVIHPFANI